ncbi:hypothetical protein [Amycolatopsis keratiniphila]|uniref:Uncharacterized protein n=1 Tax=Amycolatopsis keratiniphila subsp. keratiniphila TaxID=227715 RepID=A0A1W2LTR4_9PSEU|nr:hypothetical protein [Amycolatopsis keratiniphila]OLZ61640.1 hypothetical protein BS330_01105 [Amycolatopsis keratiniphila subsp. nogabecina]ONF68750.1 hypothetical protein AVR91_0219025 [Amycolatopsis keratiniphila subsp. keratiniphila]SDU17574.1 hypothetical protein SAMN04489733_1782 [Amycolatopsis keratiniphila]
MTTRHSIPAAATRAHLALAAHAAELADLAANAAREDEGSPPDHAGLIGMAQQIVEAAVVAARLDGKTWQEIACGLDGETPKSARARYWPSVARFRADPFPAQGSRHEGAPLRLRRLPTPEQRSETPAEPAAPSPTGHLALVTIPAEQSDPEPAAVDARLKIAERLVAAYERIATNDRQPPQWILDGLAHARRTAADLRGHAGAPPE